MFKPIPADAEQVYFEASGCGPECCGAVNFQVWCKTKSSPYRQRLWCSDTIFYMDCTDQEKQELRRELIAAAEFYNLKLDDINGDHVMEWL